MGKALHVLNIEDSESDSLLLERHLRRHGYQLKLRRVQSAETFLEALQERWDIIISDFSIPGFSGPAALKIMQEAGIDLPFLIMSGTVSEEAAVEALKAGAHDFFSKDKTARLVPAIERELREAQHRERRREAEAELRASQDRLRLAVDAAKLGIWSWNLDNDEVFFDENHQAIFHDAGEHLVIRTYADFINSIHPEDRQQVNSVFRRAAESDQAVNVEFRIADDVWLASHVKHYSKKGTEHVIGVIQNITQRKLSQIAAQEQHLLVETLRDTAVDISSTLNLRQSLYFVLCNLERIIPFTTADIMIIEDDGKSRVISSRGYEQHNLEGVVNTLKFSVSSIRIFQKVYDTGEPYIIDDIKKGRQFPQWTQDEWLQAYAGVPIFLKEKVIGFLNLSSTQKAFFTTAHIQRMESFAELAAIAIQNARLQAQAEELIATEERQRIARELHDAVNQTLFSANILTETLLKTACNDPDKTQDLLHEIYRLTNGAIAEMRSLLLELRPDQLIRGTMEEHLRLLLRALQSRKRIQTHLEVQQNYQIPADVKVAFYRVAQESLTNVLRHAYADHLYVTYTANQHEVKLSVIDDGSGFRADEATSGIGLQSMRERAKEINAEFSINSQPNAGTELVLRWLPKNT